MVDPPAGGSGTAALAEAVVDLAAIGHNARLIAQRAGTALMAVVKADGFGHGMVPVARAALAHGATWLGVTSCAEALALRGAGITAPVLSWLHRVDEDFTAPITAEVDLSVSTLPHLRAVAAGAARAGRPAEIHLKIDTGMSRNGVPAGGWAELVAWTAKLGTEGLVRVRAIWSHLAAADVPGAPSVAAQLTAYREALAYARSAGIDPPLRHLANSAAALAVPDAAFDLVRAGIGLYGVEPVAGLSFGLRPALTVRTQVINVKRVPAGTGVSYHPQHVTTGETTLALIPVGYADGVSRAVEGRAQVWIGGARCPVLGRVAMDQLVADAGDLPVRIGDEVVLLGPGDLGEPTVAEWAAWAGTNPHEIMTGLSARVSRRYASTRAGE